MNQLRVYRLGFIFVSILTIMCSWTFLSDSPTVPKKQFFKKDERNGGNLKQGVKLFSGLISKVDGQYQAIRKKKKYCKKPVFKFVYAKVHKTGSSSVRRILTKFMKKHHLFKFESMAYPAPYTGGYPGRFKCMFKIPKNSLINCHHMRFDGEEMKTCFHPDTRYFTIIRQPWSHFLSSHNFFAVSNNRKPCCTGMPKAYIQRGEEMDIAEFLSNAAVLLNTSVPFYFRFRNLQSHDLGIDPMLTDVNEIESQIKNLDKNMDLVMILEYFDESLILLKDLLCMDWSDLEGSWHLNSRDYNRTTQKDMQENENFKQLYNVDIALYDHFNRTFWKQVDAYGRNRMAKDLKILRRERKKRKKRSNFQLHSRGPKIKVDPKLTEELRNYMFENSGKCVYPSWIEH